jgi:WXG100 family type VII secretion target
MAEISKTLGSINHLDTSKFKDTANTFKKAIDSFKESKSNIKSITDKLLDTWQGDARNVFESKYNLFMGKLGDLEDTLIDYYNALLDSEMAYREADEETGKQILDSLKQN